MGKLSVVDGGIFTTIQDAGRHGFRKYGVPTSGAMDIKAFQLANTLVGNPQNLPALECTLKGGCYRFETSATVALTGADMQATLNGETVELEKAFSVNPQDILLLDYAKKGCRAYIGIRGLFDIEKIMDSYSTYVVGGFGGFDGRTLKAGDELNWLNLNVEANARSPLNRKKLDYPNKVNVQVSTAPEWNWLDDDSKSFFLNEVFSISSQSNRMGIRLAGKSLHIPQKHMLSSAVIPGIIQLPSSGHPIVLMNDGQTIGGYPRIAKVLDKDLWKLAQLKPRDEVTFELNIDD